MMSPASLLTTLTRNPSPDSRDLSNGTWPTITSIDRAAASPVSPPNVTGTSATWNGDGTMGSASIAKALGLVPLANRIRQAYPWVALALRACRLTGLPLLRDWQPAVLSLFICYFPNYPALRGAFLLAARQAHTLPIHTETLASSDLSVSSCISCNRPWLGRDAPASRFT
jgi:hypothetical protein